MTPPKASTSGILSKNATVQILQAISISTFLLTPAWKELLPGSSASYYMNVTAGPSAALAIITNTILFSTIIMLFDRFYKNKQNQNNYLDIIFIILTFCTFYNSTRLILSEITIYLHFPIMITNLGWIPFVIIYSLPIIAVSAIAVKKTEYIHNVLLTTLTITSPLFFILLFKITYKPNETTHHLERVGQKKEYKSLPPPKNALVFIFDELDQTRTFDQRDAKYNLKSMDSLKSTSTFCDQAYPPTAWTATSIPSMFTGKIIKKSIPTPNRDLKLVQGNNNETSTLWSINIDFPLILNDQGYKTLFINHYHNFSKQYFTRRPLFKNIRHPYYDSWRDAETWYRSFPSSLMRQWASIPESLPGIPRKLERIIGWEDSSVNGATKTYQNALNQTILSIKNRSADLIVVHWSIPHGPAIFDNIQNKTSETPLLDRSNLDNLPLVDITISKIQKTLESEGLWNDSLLIVTSDHWQRKASDLSAKKNNVNPSIPHATKRVPLIIKFPGQRVGNVRTKPINTASIFEIICAHFSERPLTEHSFIEWSPQLYPIGYYESGVQ